MEEFNYTSYLFIGLLVVSELIPITRTLIGSNVNINSILQIFYYILFSMYSCLKYILFERSHQKKQLKIRMQEDFQQRQMNEFNDMLQRTTSNIQIEYNRRIDNLERQLSNN